MRWGGNHAPHPLAPPMRGPPTPRALAGGVAVTLTGHPFDTLKVRLQTQDPAKPIYNGSE